MSCSDRICQKKSIDRWTTKPGLVAGIALVAALVAGLATGCRGSDHAAGNDTGWTLKDAGSDVGPDSGPPDEDGGQRGEASPMTFELVNTTDQPLKLRKRSGCTVRDGEWVSILDGERRLQGRSTCGTCSCEELERQNGCAVCACAPTSPRILESGESVTWRWKGYAYRSDQIGDRSCTRKSVPEQDAYRAKFCWSEYDVTLDAEGRPSTTCETVSFEYGSDQKVRHEIRSDSTTEPQKTTFRLVNDSDEPIRYQKSEDGVRPSWIQFSDDSIEVTRDTCGLCTCESLEKHGACPGCAAGAPLPPDEIRELKPGESTKWTWDGYTYKRDTVDEKTCHRKTIPSTGRNFNVRLCWKRGDGPVGEGLLTNEECGGEVLRYGADQTIIRRVQ
ncbi:MAG: hypothetical protein ABEN55_10475 [Bradymonadaceae bacterium]